MKKGRMMINRLLCKDIEESAYHILIYCDRTKKLRMFLLAISGPKWVFPALVRNLFLGWKFKGMRE